MTQNLLIPQPYYKGTYRVIAGDVALDFVNTLDWRITQNPYEWLDSYANLVRWAHMVGFVSPADSADLLEDTGKETLAWLQEAVILREAIYRIMSALRLQQTPSHRDLTILNNALQINFDQMYLMAHPDRFAWEWGEPYVPQQIVGRVAWATSQLLMSDRIHRLGACEACGWLFIDTTKNHSRRWCTMESCGNREKVRRHRQKV